MLSFLYQLELLRLEQTAPDPLDLQHKHAHQMIHSGQQAAWVEYLAQGTGAEL